MSPTSSAQARPAPSTFVTFDDWTGARTLASLGTNAGSESLPFQHWRRFKEAFAPELVELAVTETPGTVSHIVDPFGGSGTTALASQFLGATPTTIEVNPYLADLIEAKLAPIDFSQASLAFSRVVHRAMSNGGDSSSAFPGAPKTLVEPGLQGRFVFFRDIADRIVAYRTAIDAEPDLATKRLFRVILASALVPASNVVVSGKGRRYRRNWRTRSVPADTVDKMFREGVLQALADLRRFADRRCRRYSILRGDARWLASNLPVHDLAVFSPPYPNSADYTDVYNLELWVMGYLRSRNDNAALRLQTLRSHVQIHRDMSSERLNSPLLAKTVLALAENRHSLWNPHIPAMISAYAGDMVAVIKGIAERIRPRGRVYIVVGDSKYAGIHVPMASILSELCPTLGFRILRLEPCRSLRVSPQQGGSKDLPESLLVLGRC